MHKLNSYIIRIAKISSDEYEINLLNPETNKGRGFRYRTPLSHAGVQQIFYNLTDAQCADIIEGWPQ